jgi:translation initiation factor IF-2
MFNDRGKSVKEVTPALPAEISGLNDVPEVGEQFVVLADEKAARQLADERLQRQREQAISAQQKTTLENLFTQMGENEQLELKVVVKADVQGSAEALQNAIAQLGTEKVTVRFIHSGVGNVTETDVTLASASDAIIIGFNVNLDAKGKEAKPREGVDVRLYTVIYDAIDDVRAAMEGLLAPEIREEVIGHCEIRAIFSSAKQGMVFGGLVTDGKITRNGLARVLRNNKVVYNGHIASLKRFKDDVREVAQNYECGIVMDFPEIEVGDVVEVFERVEEAAKL